MKRMSKIASFVLAFAVLLTASFPVSAAESNGTYTAAEKEAIIAQAEELLLCENGEIPIDISLEDIDYALREFNPELAEKVFQHLEEIAVPAEPYYSEEEINAQTTNEEFAPPESYGTNSWNYIADPKNNRLTSSICKVFAFHNGNAIYGSGFFISNTVIASAAHVVYTNTWEGEDVYFQPWSWADEVYVYQAYNPDNPPYYRVYANTKNMRPGASWQTGDHSDDDDWVAIELKGTIQGSYSYLPKKQIDADNYSGKTITIYGYPSPPNIVTQPMYAIKTVTTHKPSDSTTYRTLYSAGSSSDNALYCKGMSGCPAIDSSGNVIGIFVARRSKIEGIFFCVNSFDYYLYKAMKGYE